MIKRLDNRRFDSNLALASLLIVCLTVSFCRPSNAQVATIDTDGGDDSKLRIDEPGKFSRSAEQYAHLVYEKVVPNDAAFSTQKVQQRLPDDEGKVFYGTPISPLIHPHRDSNRIRQPAKLIRPGMTILVEGNNVLLQNERTGQEVLLMSGQDVSEVRFDSKFARVAVSPSGRKLAVAVLRVEKYDQPFDPPLYDIYVLDLLVPVAIFPNTVDKLKSDEKYKPKLIREAVPGDSVLGSSFWNHAVAPPLFWADEETVIFLASQKRFLNENEMATELVASRKLFDFSDPDSHMVYVVEEGRYHITHCLFGINVDTLATETFFEMMLGGLGFANQSSEFWRRSDGEIILRAHGRDIRIDLKKREAIADRRLSPRYEVRGDGWKTSLWNGEELITESVHSSNVSVSSDGLCVAWYTRSSRAKGQLYLNTSQFLTTLWFHSPETGTVEMADGMFTTNTNWHDLDNPLYQANIQWISDGE